MKEISQNLYLGSRNDLRNFSLADDAFVHATQTTHYEIRGWDILFNPPRKNHPNYLFWVKENRLSLNWVDGEAYLFDLNGPEIFIRVLDFIDKWIDDRKVFVHCDMGISRSPSIGLLYLAKRKNLITNKSFASAMSEFQMIYPIYKPKGIGDYINQHWFDIN
jgi:hypothetical protein